MLNNCRSLDGLVGDRPRSTRMSRMSYGGAGRDAVALSAYIDHDVRRSYPGTGDGYRGAHSSTQAYDGHTEAGGAVSPPLPVFVEAAEGVDDLDDTKATPPQVSRRQCGERS